MAIEVPNYNDDLVVDSDLLSKISANLLMDIAWGHNSQSDGVMTGMSASAGVDNLRIDVESGTFKLSLINYEFSGGSVALSSPDVSDPRIDIIEVDSSGIIHATSGTASVSPNEASRNLSGIQFTRIKVAAVLVKPGDTVIPSSQILDRRIACRVSNRISVGSGAPAATGFPGDMHINHNTANKSFHIFDSNGDLSEIYGVQDTGIHIVDSSWVQADGVPSYVLPGTRILRRL